jgi:hypothetical protein
MQTIASEQTKVAIRIVVGKMNMRAKLSMPVSMNQERQKMHVEFPPEHLFEMIEEPVCPGKTE